ncbi:hypothetical protein E1B28_006462 [Marasmius oreades]|uniref:Uncharacterized protein n=1 Tax=Marasmius oreades TaxID=181124 RepID=A0A9P7S5T9_9AGAR|nr:uncharacterized protein E1B28_006462 [Marasmius oreades]KAG7095753.1 hypothetical protein E1B28_006462 [Marasmius oreades]
MTFRSDKFGDHIKGWKPDRLIPTVLDAVDRKYDYVFVATKVVPEVMTTEKILAPLLNKSYTEKWGQPIYVLLQNGMGVEEGIYTATKAVESEVGRGAAHDPRGSLHAPTRIVSACVYYMSNLIAPDIVQYVEDNMGLVVGIFRPGQYTTTHNSPEEAAILDELKDILESGGTSTTIVPEIQRRKLEKNMLNLAFATVATLSNLPVTSIFRPPPEPQGMQYQSYVYPTIAVGRALGFPDSEEGIPSNNATKFLELT